jgi:hypothetical protein
MSSSPQPAGPATPHDFITSSINNGSESHKDERCEKGGAPSAGRTSHISTRIGSMGVSRKHTAEDPLIRRSLLIVNPPNPHAGGARYLNFHLPHPSTSSHFQSFQSQNQIKTRKVCLTENPAYIKIKNIGQALKLPTVIELAEISMLSWETMKEGEFRTGFSFTVQYTVSGRCLCRLYGHGLTATNLWKCRPAGFFVRSDDLIYDYITSQPQR